MVSSSHGVNPWHVAMAVVFTLGFLFTVVFEVWRSTRGATLLSSIRARLQGITKMLTGPVGDTVDVLASAGRSPRTEVGSWIVAVAAFLLIALRQTDLLPLVPLGLSPARFILIAGAVLWVLTRLMGQRSGYRVAALGPILTIYALSLIVAYGAQMTRPAQAPDTDPIFAAQILLVLVVPFFVAVIHGYDGLLRVVKGLIAGGVVSATLAVLTSLTGNTDGLHLRIPGLVDGAASRSPSRTYSRRHDPGAGKRFSPTRTRVRADGHLSPCARRHAQPSGRRQAVVALGCGFGHHRGGHRRHPLPVGCGRVGDRACRHGVLLANSSNLDRIRRSLWAGRRCGLVAGAVHLEVRHDLQRGQFGRAARGSDECPALRHHAVRHVRTCGRWKFLRRRGSDAGRPVPEGALRARRVSSVSSPICWWWG